jgi:putative ABC transport system permease protein
VSQQKAFSAEVGNDGRSFEALTAYFAFFDYGRITLTGRGAPERLRDVSVSGNFLETLGVPLLYGRNFTAEECVWQGPRAVIRQLLVLATTVRW